MYDCRFGKRALFAPQVIPIIDRKEGLCTFSLLSTIVFRYGFPPLPEFLAYDDVADNMHAQFAIDGIGESFASHEQLLTCHGRAHGDI